ncbi:MAG TPA: 50S ribosomal protein L32 [Patescibacteria group bacterium]|nr:50S ribosomal protein L32 [Patescibacteria group bacterium]
MSQEPKKRHSRARQGKRRASIKLTTPNAITCPNCAAKIISHRICSKCGYYRGEQVVAQKTPTSTNQS